MEHIFSLGLDYENQKAYDKVTGEDLRYENLGGGNIYPVIMEDGTPVLDLNTNNNYRYILQNNESNNFRLNCGTGDWLIKFTLAIDSNTNFDVSGLIGLVTKSSYQNNKTQIGLISNNPYPDIEIHVSSENVFRNLENITYENENFNSFQYHNYIIAKISNQIKMFVDGKYAGSTPVTQDFVFDFYGIVAPGFLYRRLYEVSNVSQNIFYGKVKSFDWYKGDLGSFVTTNLKLGD